MIRWSFQRVFLVVCVAIGGCSRATEPPSPAISQSTDPASSTLPGRSTSRSTLVAAEEAGVPMAETPIVAPRVEDTHDEDEERLAEEMLAVATAKARAFSPRVRAMQAQYQDVFSQQFENQVLQDAFLPRSPRRRRQLTRGVGAGARSASDVAGAKQLLEDQATLRTESDIVLQKFVFVLQEETWKRLAPAERDLIVKYDLIPQEVRDSGGRKPEATVGSEPSAHQTAEARTTPPATWHVVALEDTPYELAFPGKPDIQREENSIAYIWRDQDRVFVFRRFIHNLVPDGVTIETMLDAQAAAALQRAARDQVAAAVKTTRLADNPARLIGNYALSGRLERADLNCVTIIGREVAVAEVLNINVSEEPVAQQFFDSFRRRSTKSDD